MSVLRLKVDRYLPNTGNLPYSLLNAGLRETIIRRLDRVTPSTRPLLFAISPGRSGSEFLATLIDATANASAVHEPRPKMNGAFLRGLSEARLKSTYDRRRVKIVQLLRALGSLAPGCMYAETSHMFVKTFYDVVLDFFADVRVVHLRRDTVHVIRSFAELGYFSNASTHWRHWMHDPHASEPLVAPAVEEGEADSFDRIIAYLIDIEARAARLRERYPATPVVAARLEEISEPAGARRLVDQLGLEWTDAAAAVCARRKNRRAGKKRIVGQPVDVAYCRERLDHYLELARRRSLPLPNGFQGWL